MIDVETHSTISLWSLFKRLRPSLDRERTRFGLGILLVGVTTALEVISPLWIGRAVDFAIERKVSELVLACKVFLGLVLLKAVLDSILAYVIQTTGQRLMHALRGQLFEHILRLPVIYFDRNPTGRLLTRVMNDIKSLGELFTASLSVLVLDVLVIATTVIAMLVLDWRLGSLILLTFPGVVWVILHFGTRLNQGYRVVRLELSRMNAFLGENIAAIATIQRLSAERQRSDRFDEIVGSHQAAQIDALTLYAKVQPYANVLNGVAMATLIGGGGFAVIRGQMTLGTVVIFLGYVRNLFQPIRDLVEKYNNYLSARVSAERIGMILAEAPEESDLGTGFSSKDGLSFKGVTFTYPGRSRPALKDISFSVESGTSLAVVGPTGGGKSTLVRLLLKFYRPEAGTIWLYGHPLEEWNLKALRKEVGVVHQEVYLVEGTLRENLTLGMNVNDDVLLNHLRESGLWELAERRGGLDMRVFEGGTNLSAGERQWVQLTRILVFNPPLVVLDEATASLDRNLEARMMLLVESMLRGRTSIVIAHRLSTIRKADRVLVIDEGSIVQEGTYQSLSRCPGVFSDFLKNYNEEVMVEGQ